MPRRSKFRGTTSYGQQFHAKTYEPVHEIRCKTEMSGPSGEMDLMTITRELPSHQYGRPRIHRPLDNDIFVEPDEGYSTAAGSGTSTSLSNTNYNLPDTSANNHHTGYERMSRSVKSTLNWTHDRDMETMTTRMFPPREVKRYKKVDRNDFVKYVDFGFDTPVHVSVYGGDFRDHETAKIKPSPVQRKSSTISLECSHGVVEDTSMYGDQFRGEKGSPALPSLTELDNNLRSSIELK